VERLGGRLDAKSELGKGSTFSIYLRCSAINHHTMDVLLHRKRVLILDDASKEYGRLVSALQQNYEVFGENSEDNALNSILYDDPHLILIDMGMENAVKIVEAIRKISSTIPIVEIIERFLIEG
jgi:PleD family two-component response regulator